jgi:hypothetical protein
LLAIFLTVLATAWGAAQLAPNSTEADTPAPVVKVAQVESRDATTTAPVVKASQSTLHKGEQDAITRVVSESADLTTVTIYPDNLALITEVRKVNVPEGRSTIAFEGVSDLIIPQSMILREFTGFTLERNFDYDLLSKTTLFENAVGDLVTLTRFDEASGKVIDQQAEIISARRDTGVVMRVDGKIETLSCSGLTERVSFKSTGEGLSAKPIMSVQVNAEAAGEQEVVISYLTSGLGWKADYRIDLKGTMEGKPTGTRKASLLAWLTLSNRTAKDYADVPLAIIAGDLNRDRDTRAVSPPKPYLQGQCYPIGSTKRGVAERIEDYSRKVIKTPASTRERFEAPMAASYSMGMMADEIVVTGARKMATEENVGDYKLYRVPGLVSVKPYQTKQIAFLNEDSVEVGKYYVAHVYGFQDVPNPQHLTLTYDLNNDREDGLARSLPTGTFRIFDVRESGHTVFLGETQKDNLAVDEDVELVMSRAMNVQMKSATGGSKASVTHSFFNATKEDVRVKVINNDVSLRGKKLRGAEEFRDSDEIIPTWWIDVPSESVAELSYRK